MRSAQIMLLLWGAALAEPRPRVYFVSGKQGFPNLTSPDSICGQPKLRDLMFFGNQDDHTLPGFQRSKAPTYTSPLADYLTGDEIYLDPPTNGAEIVANSWNCFRGDNGSTDELNECSCGSGGWIWYHTDEWDPKSHGWLPPRPGGSSKGWTFRNRANDLNNARFIDGEHGAAKFLNDQMPTGRRVILIGHSAGGDTILQAVTGLDPHDPPIRRPLTAVVVIDPVTKSAEGPGTRLTSRRPRLYGTMPGNVELFMNRWQENNTTGRKSDLCPWCPVCPYCLDVNLPLNAPTGMLWSDGRLNPLAASAYFDNTGVTLFDGVVAINQRKVVNFEDAGPGTHNFPGALPYLANHGTLIDALPAEPGGRGGGLGVNQEIVTELKKVLRKRIIVALSNQGSGTNLQARDSGGSGVALSTNLGLWEYFEMLNDSVTDGSLSDGDSVRFAASSGHWLGVEANGDYMANRQKSRRSESFTILRVSANGDSLPGKIHHQDFVHIKDFSGGFMCRNHDNNAIVSRSPLGPDCRYRLSLKRGTRFGSPI